MKLKVRKVYILAALVIIILFFGVGFFSMRFLAKEKAPTSAGFTKNTTKKITVDKVIMAEGPNLTPFPSGVSILMAPPPEASEEDFKTYRANIEYNAVATNKIVLKNCMATPVVAKIVQGTKFTLENNDNEDHLISFNKDNTFTLKANEKKEMTADFGKGLGIYTYGCDEYDRPMGALLIRSSL